MGKLTFELSDTQIKQVDEFKKKHRECFKGMPTATEGNYPITYSFTPGGIGTIAVIKCNGCGKELNITEYENW